MKTSRYVVGFAYSSDKSRVMLIRKQKPEWQKGCLNGIGGKIEPGEQPDEAMQREGVEETGLVLEWTHKGYMSGTNNDGSSFECHIFYAYTDQIFGYQQVESEQIGLFSMDDLNGEKVIENLNFLIPYGRCNDHSQFMTLSY